MLTSAAHDLVVVEEHACSLLRRGWAAHEECLRGLFSDVLLDRRFNCGETFLDNVHAVKQAFSECEIVSTDGRRIELVLKKSGCQLSLAFGGEQTEDIRE